MTAENPVKTDINVRTLSMRQVSDAIGRDYYVNLQDCSFIGSEFDVTVTDCDSMTAVVFPDRRYEFTVLQDTILMVCEENRDMKMSFPSGLAIDINGVEPYVQATIQTTGRYRQNFLLSGESTVVVGSPYAAAIITAEGDTLSDVRHDRFRRSIRLAFCQDTTPTIDNIPDSLVMTSTTDTDLITLLDEEFPRVIKRVTTISGSNGQTTDSVTYILTSTPVRLAAGRQKARPEKYNTPGSSDHGSSISISPNGESITIRPTYKDGELTVVINDISGRIFLSNKVPNNDQSTVDISFLPKGEYLIQLLDDGQTADVVKYINK